MRWQAAAAAAGAVAGQPRGLPCEPPAHVLTLATPAAPWAAFFTLPLAPKLAQSKLVLEFILRSGEGIGVWV